VAEQRVFPVAEISDVGTARRHALRIAADASLDETQRGRVAVIATELATNLVRHGRGGQLIMQDLHVGGGQGMEVIAIDSGPGMADKDACMRDGFSSGGTRGNGLGAVRRLSDEFDIFSHPGQGTVVLSRVAGGAAGTPSPSAWRWGAISTPAPGETAIGDSWRLSNGDDEVRLLIADGLGHGPLASEAAESAVGVFEAAGSGSLKPFFERAHAKLRSTRGAAVAVASCVRDSTRINYAGVGNISGVIVGRGGATRGLMSHNGTVGAEMRAVQELPYEWSVGDRLVMHSDGIATRWQLGAYPGLATLHPAVTTALLYRDFLRGRDDATVVVLERST
jgi:anti-sigma regulatory factor (Ser/Thr protein kinase)